MFVKSKNAGRNGCCRRRQERNFMNPELYASTQKDLCVKVDKFDPALFERYGVKRGLRDKSGEGVMAGINTISEITAFQKDENGVFLRDEQGAKIPCDGQLRYRGYDVIDLVRGFAGQRFGYNEAAYLLLFGDLPDAASLAEFEDTLNESRWLPKNFTRDVIMKAPSQDVMNSMMKSVLTLAAYDDRALDTSLENVIRQCLLLISVFPQLGVYAYHAYSHYLDDESMYIHRPNPLLSPAENILMMLRPDKSYTELEAEVLDVALVLHMEHGGGNNSTFTTRVVTSSGADTYATMAAALASLKGPKHGGANLKVVNMMRNIRDNIKDHKDEDEVRAYLGKVVDKQAFDNKGLIYGLGHAVYSISDPRERVFKQFVEMLAVEKHEEDMLALYSMVERIAPEVIAERRHIYKGVSPNVDYYSGFVYSMLGIPTELYTPIFAMARIVGWSAHRIDELINVDKIIRPAYKEISAHREYSLIEDR